MVRFPIKNFPPRLFAYDTGQKLAWEVMTKEEKQQLVLDFERAIKEFIVNSLGWDINKLMESAEITLGQIIGLFAKSQPAFILIEFDEAMKGHGYDESNYYGLGKLGRGMIEPEKMKEKIILTAEDFDGLGLDQKTELNSELFERILRFASEKLFDKIYRAIKEKIINN